MRIKSRVSRKSISERFIIFAMLNRFPNLRRVASWQPKAICSDITACDFALPTGNRDGILGYRSAAWWDNAFGNGTGRAPATRPHI